MNIRKSYQAYYCLGFAFKGKNVLLIEKKRPDWQKDKLNGIGGHVEKCETSFTAMVREFKEEVGVTTVERDWYRFARLDIVNCKKELVLMDCFRINMLDISNMGNHAITDECLEVHDVYQLPIDRCVGNLKWIVQMGYDLTVTDAEIMIR